MRPRINIHRLFREGRPSSTLSNCAGRLPREGGRGIIKEIVTCGGEEGSRKKTNPGKVRCRERERSCKKSNVFTSTTTAARLFFPPFDHRL